MYFSSESDKFNLSAEWSVYMKVRLYDENTSFRAYDFCTIAEFTRDNSQVEHGYETLMIRMGKQNNLNIDSKSIFDSEAILPYPLLVVDQQVKIKNKLKIKMIMRG